MAKVIGVVDKNKVEELERKIEELRQRIATLKTRAEAVEHLINRLHEIKWLTDKYKIGFLKQDVDFIIKRAIDELKKLNEEAELLEEDQDRIISELRKLRR